MAFQFVDNSSVIDRASRKRIRRHVAVGRNAGKKLVRQSKRKASTITVKLDNARSKPETTALIWNELLYSKPERQIGDGLSILSLPTPVTSGSRREIQQGK